MSLTVEQLRRRAGIREFQLQKRLLAFVPLRVLLFDGKLSLPSYLQRISRVPFQKRLNVRPNQPRIRPLAKEAFGIANDLLGGEMRDV